MSCDNKIDSFFSKSKGLLADLSYGLYKEITFGNTSKAQEYEKHIQDIESISWLLERHERSTCSCSPISCLCSGAASDASFSSEEFINGTLDQNGQQPYLVELWKGVLKNTKSGKLISLSSRALDEYDPACELINGDRSPLCRLNPGTHKSLRFWEWEGNVPTMVFDTGEIFNGIQNFDVVSFYYSSLHDSYYIRVEDLVDGSLLFKISSDFTDVQKVVVGTNPSPQGASPQYVLMEVIDSLNYVLVNDEPNQNILVYSLADLTLIKTIDRTGVFFQKMTWDESECNLFLTGRADNDPAEVNLLDINSGVITNKLTDSALRNNTSIITSDGNLLVLNYDTTGFLNEMVFQKFNTCDDGELIETINTGINLSIGVAEFIVIHSLLEDKDGNIIVTYLLQGGNTEISVFDKDFNLKFTRDLDWGVFGANLPNSWTNTNILDDGTLIIHEPQQNGVGGTETYYLDYNTEALEVLNPGCVVLTDDEVCSLINKLNGIPSIKKYSTPTNGINSNISSVDCCNKLFIFKQLTPSSSWLIIHNLDTFPVITTTDSSGNKILGTEVYVDNNTVRIDFTSPIDGVAYLTYNIQ